MYCAMRKKCPYSELFWYRMRENAGKIRTRITPYTDTFYAVVNSLGKFDFCLMVCILGLFSTLKNALIANAIFLIVLWTLKGLLLGRIYIYIYI